jgi:hypothetical protein
VDLSARLLTVPQLFTDGFQAWQALRAPRGLTAPASRCGRGVARCGAVVVAMYRLVAPSTPPVAPRTTLASCRATSVLERERFVAGR